MSGTAVLRCGCPDLDEAAIDLAVGLLPVEGGEAIEIRRVHSSEGRCAVAEWAASGGMSLTGHDDEPLVPSAPVLSHARAALTVTSALVGVLRPDEAATLLFGRAALLGIARRGRLSAAGTCHLLRAADGWLAVSLARPHDLEAIPAIIGADDATGAAALEDAARTLRARDLAERCQLLGVPASALAPHDSTRGGRKPARPAIRFQRLGPRLQSPNSAPLVVDLSSLWAGPLCAYLLGQTGARIVKVESSQRPDGARSGDRRFFDWLHAGHQSVAIDFTSAHGAEQLRRLVARADIVIEASRPRALRQLGIDAEEVVASSPGRTWLSITGYGREGAGANDVAFGDDAAVAGGLVARDGTGEPVFCADAIADPLTGIFAAMAACGSLAAGGGHLIDVAMSGVAEHVASSLAFQPGAFAVRHDGTAWRVDHGGATEPVEQPRAPSIDGRAEPVGASTERVLRELLSA